MATSRVPSRKGGTDEGWEFSEGRSAYAFRQPDTQMPVGNECRQLGGASEAMFSAGKTKYMHLGVSDRDARRVFAP